ncbi:uncharacterized protein KGF55_004555 [Candida pseudojiufengensis]|uniref:uncharacterized protein n=1 Tax=Candida pseudojiufengensis TaxID=497109 RepID=UPI002224268A|nr:uncharacterized protein KGF55_004555 [Candida pseudojiufengensis]KAI5960662.1 hypothetical protein KGF55_004555 [Candida pseudojiufengensis]
MSFKSLFSKSTNSSKFRLNQLIKIGILLFTISNVLLILYYITFENLSNSSTSNTQDLDEILPSSLKSSSSSLSFKSLLKYIKSSSTENDAKNNLIDFYYDNTTNLLIIEKNHNLNEDSPESSISTNSQENLITYINSDSKQNYDLHLIEGYNYQDYTNNLKTKINSYFENSISKEYETELKFNESLKQFFLNLVEKLEDCKPNIGSINNNEHYSNKIKIEKYYQNLNKLSDEQMKEIPENQEYIHKLGHIPVFDGHLREQYINEPVRTKEYLSLFLQLNDSEISSLKQSHEKFINSMPNEWPKDLLIENNNINQNQFLKGDGIVYLAGGKYDQLVLLSIKILRKLGSNLPIEIMIPTQKDYNLQFCNEIIPSLNGKCIIMNEFIPDLLIKNNKFGSYLLKNIAILLSSFENVLYLDADNLPIKNPDNLFVNKPFIDNHLIIWPDLWRRSTSPLLYDIADIKVDTNNKVRNSYLNKNNDNDNEKISFHDCEGSLPEASSETGQILINKKHHFKTLILSFFYNYYGPEFYYPLLSQGAAGEGDKESFIFAAHRLNLSYYQVKEFNREFGPISEKTEKIDFFGMGQYDPIIDYIQSKSLEEDETSTTKTVRNVITKRSNENQSNYKSQPPTNFATNQNDKSISNYNYHFFKSSSLIFLHANWPKFFINELFSNDSGRGTKDKNGNRRRLYGNELKLELQNNNDNDKDSDFELIIIKNLFEIWCLPPWINLIDVPKSESDKRKEICNNIKLHKEFLENS